MKRAAVLIGVDKTGGGLQKLKVARSGAEKMEAWAREAGFETHLITDAAGPVTAQAIRKTIKDLVEPSNLDQLLVYFAGHGVNIRFGEFWLLSDAPEEGDQAVNVASAKELAHRCGIPHVVLISDACRTAAGDIQMQSIEGNAIFPNFESGGPEKPVDLFFACTLGAPSHEIRDPNDAARRYQAVYTEELHAALRGNYPEILVADAADGSMILRPRPLRKLLGQRVPLRIGQLLGDPVPISQLPDARITSDDDAWLARFAGGQVMPESVPLPPAAPSLPEVTGTALRRVLSRSASASQALEDLLRADVEGVQEIAGNVRREVAPSGPLDFETRCGFKVRGAEFREAVARAGKAELLDPSRVIIDIGEQPAVNVLLVLQDGRGILLPAIRDFVATLSFEEGELRNVAYEPAPAENSERWREYIDQKEELSTLRSLIASNAHLGGFRLPREGAEQLTKRIRFAKGLDPTMALYAAYSYHNLSRRNLIQRMQEYLRGDIRITFFDLALLSGEGIPRDPAERRIFPFLPMLAQGWSLLDAFGVSLPGRLSELKRHVGTSLWTVFDPGGVRILRDSIGG